MCCVNSWILDTFTQCIWAPPITEVLRFECGNAIEIRNEIKFNFYSGLPHLCLIYVCMYFTGEFSDIKSLENLRNFVSSASMPRTVTAPRTTAIWKFLQNIQDYALCHSYSPPLHPFLSLSCFSPLPLLSSSSLPSPLSPSSLPSALPFIFSHSQAKWRFSDNTQTGNLSVTILKILADKPEGKTSHADSDKPEGKTSHADSDKPEGKTSHAD